MKTKKTNSRKRQSPLARLQRHAKQILVPHKGNQYQPHLIRRYGLVAVVVLVIGVQFGRVEFSRPSVLGVHATLTAPELITDGNAARTRQGLAPLASNDKLTRAAYLKAQDMFAGQYWAHVSPSGVTPWQWFGKVGYNYAAAGENLAKNFTTAEATTDAWMASPEHRANILNAHYRDVGYAVVDGMLNGKPTTLVVALYGQPAAKGTVVAATTSQNAPAPHALGPLTRFGIALESLTPAVLGSLVLMAAVAIVALGAHFHRDKLPKARRQSWYRHHGAAKAAGMLSLAVIVLFLSGSGQI